MKLPLYTTKGVNRKKKINLNRKMSMLLRKAVEMLKLLIKYSFYSGQYKDYPMFLYYYPRLL